MAESDYVMGYKPGKANVVVDALSRKAMLASASSITSNLFERIKEGTKQNPLARGLMEMAKDGKT